MPNILTDLSARQAAKNGSRKAVSFKEPGSDRWTPITWSELDRNVSMLAHSRLSASCRRLWSAYSPPTALR